MTDFRQAARLLAGNGARVALLARTADQLEQTARPVTDAGSAALVVPVDLTDRNQCGAFLINNAGVTGRIGPTATIDMAEWVAAIEIGLIAPAALTTAVLPGMVEQGFGQVLDVSSDVVRTPERLERTGGARSQPRLGTGRHRRAGERLPARRGGHLRENVTGHIWHVDKTAS